MGAVAKVGVGTPEIVPTDGDLRHVPWIQFGELLLASWLGTDGLEAHDRRTVRIHVNDPATAARTLERLFEQAMK